MARDNTDYEEGNKMREIKFRAWDIENKRYNHLSFSIYKVNMIDQDPSRWLFLQYTGLKDKNDKEIYEGDILSIPPDAHHHYEERNVVEYGDGVYLLEDHGLYLNDWNEMGEVIGNIYENPELLEE